MQDATGSHRALAARRGAGGRDARDDLRRRHDRRARARRPPAGLARDLRGRPGARLRRVRRRALRARPAQGQPGQDRDAGQGLGELPGRAAGRHRGAAATSRPTAGWRRARPSLSGPNAHAYSDLDDNDVAGALARRSRARSRSASTPASRRPARAARSPSRAPGTTTRPTAGRRTGARAWSRPSTSPTASTTTWRRTRSASTPRGAASTRASTRSWSRPTTASAGQPLQQRLDAHAAGRPLAADGAAAVPPERLPDDEHRRRRLDRLPRVHARALEPARDRRRRARRAELAAGGRDGRGLERLVREGLHRRAVPGARHRDARARSTWAPTPTTSPHTIRAQALDCPVGAPGRGPARRPARAGSGGFTYGDFGKIVDGPEVHADGEIWAQTLWDLRAAVGIAGRAPADHRRHAAVAARADVPGHAQRDPARRPGRRAAPTGRRSGPSSRSAGWATSPPRSRCRTSRRRPRRASRAARSRASSPTPRPGAAIAGRDGGDRLARRRPGPARGHERRRRRATASAACPARTYSNLVVSAPGYDRVVLEVTVPAGRRSASTSPLRRNWAARSGGAQAIPGPGSDEYADQGCGPDAAIDQLQATAWSTDGLAGRQVDGRGAAAGRRRDRASRSTRARAAATTPTRPRATTGSRRRRAGAAGRGRSPSTGAFGTLAAAGAQPGRGDGAPACGRSA